MPAWNTSDTTPVTAISLRSRSRGCEGQPWPAGLTGANPRGVGRPRRRRMAVGGSVLPSRESPRRDPRPRQGRRGGHPQSYSGHDALDDGGDRLLERWPGGRWRLAADPRVRTFEDRWRASGVEQEPGGSVTGPATWRGVGRGIRCDRWILRTERGTMARAFGRRALSRARYPCLDPA